jgi:hypothetical protein
MIGNACMSLHPYESDFARQVLLHKFYSVGEAAAPLFVRATFTAADRALGEQMGITIASTEEFSRVFESDQRFDAVWLHGLTGGNVSTLSNACRPWGLQEIARACARVASGGSISFTAPDSRYVRRATNPMHLAKMLSKRATWSVPPVLSHLNSIGFVCRSICTIEPNLSSPVASETVFPTTTRYDSNDSNRTWVKRNALMAINYLGLRTTPDILFCATRK